MTFALAIHPLTMKNRPCVLIWACALNRKNTVLQKMMSERYQQISQARTFGALQARIG